MADKEIYRLDLAVNVSGDEAAKGKLRAMDRYIEQTEKRGRMLDRLKISPAARLVDKVSEPARRITSTLERLSSKSWAVTLRAKDEASRIIERVRSVATSVPAVVGITVTAVGLGAAAGSAVKKAMSFEAQLSTIKALTGASKEEMSQVQALAMEMGAKTKYSALEAAQGMEELLKAGLSVSQVKGGGLEAALNLATAGGLDLAEASEIMSTALNAYKADAMTAAQASNILAGTANASATSVHELRYSLAAVSAVASGVGLTFQDTNAALGVFAMNGLKGSDAGTSLKTMLMNLSPSTKGATEMMSELGIITKDGTNQFYDAKGKIKSMAEIADVLRNALIKLNPKERGDALKEMFGSDAIRAGNILFKEGAEGIKKMIAETNKVTALDVAKEKMNNAAGAVEQFNGAMETMQISALMPTMPIIKDFALLMADLAGRYTPAVTKEFEKLSARAKEFLSPFFEDVSTNTEVKVNGWGDFRKEENRTISQQINSWAEFRYKDDPEAQRREKIRNMDWSDKVIYVLDGATDAMSTWMAGPGGDKVEKIFGKLAEIGFNAWFNTLQNLMEGSMGALHIPEAWGNLKEGNLSGAWESLKGGNAGAGLGMAAIAGLLGGGLLVRGAWGMTKGAWNLGKGAWDVGKNMFGRGKKEEEAISSGRMQSAKMDVNTVAIRAGRVYVSGPTSSIGGSSRGGTGSILGPDGRPLQRDNGGRRRFRMGKPTIPDEPVKKGFRERVKGMFSRDKAPTTGLEQAEKLSRIGRFGRAAGIAGTVASTAVGAYGLYQAIRQDGWKQAVATRGGAVAGSAIGGAVGGFVGSFAGPLGTAAGAYAGSWLGEKAGRFMDTKGVTKQLVQEFSDLKTKITGWWKGDDSKKAQTDMKAMGVSAGQHTQQTKQQLTQLGTASGQTANTTKTSLGSIQTVTSQGGTWGTTMISQLISGIQSQLPGLAAAAASVATTIQSSMNVSMPTISAPAVYGPPVPKKPLPSPTTWGSRYTGGNSSSPFKKYARGGFISSPHMGLVGEAGPEVIIPLSSERRERALSLWERAGKLLGVSAFANGGLVGAESFGPSLSDITPQRDFSLERHVEKSQDSLSSSPSMTSVVSSGGNHDAALYLTVDAPVNFTLQQNGDIDEEALALKIGWQIVGQMKQAMENRGVKL